MHAHPMSSWTWPRLLAPALVMLGLAACHEVAVVELPARGAGRTALWLLSRTEAVSGGQLVCPTPAEEETPELDPCLEVIAQAHDRDEPPALKVFARRGDVSIAYVELACSLDVLGLTAGPQDLATEPFEPRRVPRALSAQVWSSARPRWGDADTTDEWIDAALTRVRFAENLKCRLRHAELTLLPLAQRVVRSLSTTPDGGVLAVAVTESAILGDDETIQSVTLTSTSGEPLLGAGLVESPAALRLLDDRGVYYEGDIGRRVVARAVSRTVAAPWGELTRVGEMLVATSGLDTSQADRGPRSTVARYDGNQAWTVLHDVRSATSAMSSITITHTLRVDDTLAAIVGADVRYVDRDLQKREGAGRLLEVTRTSSTWVQLMYAGRPALAVGGGSTADHGAVVSAIVCTEVDDCNDSALFHRVDGRWVELPGSLVNDWVVFSVLGPRPGMRWIGGSAEFRFRGRGARAIFDDRLECPATTGEIGTSVFDLFPLGEYGLVMRGFRLESDALLYSRPPVAIDEPCEASSY
jgi:hypothetical protein